jgi:16S rRNA (uracil1498-N3)-methyltransferase
MSRPPVRLFVDVPLAAGVAVALEPPASHYLITVMRHDRGDMIELFNGRDGAWQAQIVEPHRKRTIVQPLMQTMAQETPPDLWLLCAPLKKERLNWTAEKACELGAARFVLVQTARSMSERLKEDRLRAHMIEAAEQCGRSHVPDIAPLVKLEALLADWPPDRALLFCDESGGAPMLAALQRHARTPSAILIGPEGGFTPEEAVLLRAHAATVAVSLGPRILRADTAAVAAITLWQATLGDW